MPIHSADGFVGVVDLVSMKAVRYVDETLGAESVLEEIPEECREDADGLRELLIEKVSEASDEILDKYLHGETILEEEIRAALRRRVVESVRGGEAPFVPVLCGSAFKNKGVQPLLDAVVDYLPSPGDVPPINGLDPRKPDEVTVERPADDDAPFSALAFKIMTDPFVGQLTFIRVYSGVMKSGASVFNPARGRRERVGRLLKMHANKREETPAGVRRRHCRRVGRKSVFDG